jgi:hypothetical protein
MIRTQVYLRGDQFQKIRLKARMEKKPEAELIRELVDEGFEAKYGAGKHETAGEALHRLAKLGKELGFSGPTHLSSHIDDILYGKTTE